MLKMILVLALVLGLATLTQAQNTTHTKRTPEQRAEHTTKGLKKKLGLSPDQCAQIMAIITDRESKMTDKFMYGIKVDALSKQVTMDEADKKINAVLTPDQQKMYAQIEANAKQKATQKKLARQIPQQPVVPQVQSN